ncbi:MAG: MerR family transcriptional regulator [Bdellovibrionales bacterium]|nr:MerR family transcriptional regulator [Bdellovibrionales bacterium]
MSSKNFPHKYFYKIGEVAEIIEVEPYVLRYWETEFNLKISKTKNKQRLYQRKDVEKIQEIKHLLYDEKFTISGAKTQLKKKKKKKSAPSLEEQMNLLGQVKGLTSDREFLRKMKKEFEHMKNILQEKDLSQFHDV